ncbi:pseudouridine synthase [Leptospira sp. GIMC2001]|uniref:pseudouridine synthase n=1 Tax=Leptospira sp. GIMC2001 TaxID=1513297 RepID=UPI00234A6167|nr:pseudouridine synthase [Leptospira sp. GIMC2001]WCL50020.1 pseudouridine synthase [Leptospira sp. GIMC2001]
MNKTERVDKILSNLGIGTRKEVKYFLRDKRVKLNGNIVTDAGTKVKPDDQLQYDDEILDWKEFVYYMINKPTGCITATEDPNEKTIMDYLSERDQGKKLFPIGRLDKDTEGFLILTNDGMLNHNLTSPKHHIYKTYLVHVDKDLEKSDILAFEKGVTLDEGYVCLPAKLEILDKTQAIVQIREGKFRQIRRMFTALGKEVVYLKRTKMGDLPLDDSLDLGQYRELTEDELEILRKK